MIKVKDIFQKSKHDTNGTNIISRNNCGSQCNDNIPMIDAMLEIKLNNYYLGNALNVSSNENWVKPGNSWIVNFNDNYTGFVDYDPGNEVLTNTWAQNGVLNIPISQNIVQGNYSFRFRRHLPDLPDNIRVKGEILDPAYTNNLTWSNPLTVYFTDTTPITTPIPSPTSPPLFGDLVKNGMVNIFDYNNLIGNFGNSTCGNVADIDGNCRVDIFDYNILVGNFGLPAGR